jgi:hypothetical protein
VAIDVTELNGATIADVLECGTEQVPYTMFVIEVADWFDDAQLSWENDKLYWWHFEEIASLRLHAGFARAWTALSTSVPRLSMKLDVDGLSGR